MTSGAKFGGDFLAYPGDPLLYHAQFTVRCVRNDAPQHPLALASAARMAHAARYADACTAQGWVAGASCRLSTCPDFPARRKHVILASVHTEADGFPAASARIEYLTLSPDIQQSSNRERPAPRDAGRGAVQGR
jgi:hypothetical protein